MNVLLVQPIPPHPQWPRGSFRSRWVPTGLAYIGRALLEAGHRVRILCQEEGYLKSGGDRDAVEAAVTQTLTEFQPHAVGLSATTPCIPTAEHIAARVKQSGDALVVLGGPHASALPQQTLRDCPHVDVVALGEGERTMAELVAKGPGPHLRGIAYREGERVVLTPARPPETELDALGPPAYELFDMAHYTARDRWLIRWLPLRATNVRTSRGCTNRCRFCAGHVVCGLGVRYHSVEYVLDLVEGALKRWGVEAIRFEDDSLGADRARLLRLCEGIRSRGLHERIVWDGCLRVDQAEPELLAQMRSAGCIQVEYGFESGSSDSLRRLGKNSTEELNRRAVRLTRQAGLRIFADIMVGLPGETAEDMDATVSFVRWAKPEVLSLAQLMPLPGTPIYENLPDQVRAGLRWQDYAYFDSASPRVNLTAMGDDEYAQRIRRLMKYFVRPTLTRQLLRDTPQHWQAERRELSRRSRTFLLKHPLRWLRLPC